MLKAVQDTHRLMYRNAKIKAIALSDHTTSIPFYNITDIDTGTAENIGYEVRTDQAGYVYYGADSRPVQCLAVAQSAIIQVDITGHGAFDIQWTINANESDNYIRVSDVYKAFYANGSLAWDPLTGDWHIPDFALKSQLGNGLWAEGELVVDSANPYDLPIDKWTHTVVFKSGHAASHRLLRSTGRYGQVLHMYNLSSEPVILGSDQDLSVIPITIQVELKPYEQATAIYTAGLGWIIAQDNAISNTYIHNTTDPLIIDLNTNPNLESIVINTAPSNYKIILKSTETSAKRPLTITNNTATSLLLVGRKIEGDTTTDFAYDEVLSRSLAPVTAGAGYAYLQSNSNYSIVHDSASATLLNDHIHVIYLPSWQGTVELTTSLLGYTFPIQVVLKTNDTGDMPGEARTLTIKLNNHTIFTSTQTYLADTHYAGELMASLSVRRTKVPGDPADPTTLNVDSYCVTVFDGSFT